MRQNHFVCWCLEPGSQIQDLRKWLDDVQSVHVYGEILGSISYLYIVVLFGLWC